MEYEDVSEALDRRVDGVDSKLLKSSTLLPRAICVPVSFGDVKENTSKSIRIHDKPTSI